MIFSSFVTSSIAYFESRSVAHPATISQQSEGWCSPNIANVIGDVYISCIGVDPRAVRRLNRELKQKKLRVDQALKEAEEWAKRYHELEAELTENTQGNLSREAEEFLRQGDLEKAEQILNHLLDQDERNVSRAAADQYAIGLVNELRFRSQSALMHFAKAYQYRPENIVYGSGYGSLLLAQRDYKKSESILKDATEHSGHSPTESRDSRTARLIAFGNLGIIYSQSQRIEDAKRAFLEAANIAAGLHDDSSLADALNSLGSLYSDLHDFKKAEEYLNQALSIRVDVPSNDKWRTASGTAHALNSLAIVYVRTGQYSKAEEYLNRSVEIYERLSAENRAFLPRLGMELSNGAVILSQIGNFSRSEQLYKRALSIYRPLSKAYPQIYGSELAIILMNYAHLNSLLGHRDEAKSALVESIKILRPLEASNHAVYESLLAQILVNYGNLCADEGDWDTAKRSFEESIDIYRKLVKIVPDAYMSDLGLALNGLGRMYYVQHNFTDAEDPLRDSLRIRETLAQKHLDSFDEDVAITSDNLGLVLMGAHRVEEAEGLFMKALMIRRHLCKIDMRVYGNGLAHSLNNLGLLYDQEKKDDDAAKVLDEARAVSLSLYQQDPRVYAEIYGSSLLTSGQFYGRIGRTADAVAAIQQAKAVFESMGQEDSVESSNNLRRAEELIKRFSAATPQ